MTVQEQTLQSWYVEDPQITVQYASDPEVGPYPSGYTVDRPEGCPDLVADEYVRVLSDFDGQRCALGPEGECVEPGGTVIGFHLSGYTDTYGNELEREDFREFTIVLIPAVAGLRAVSVCVDCEPASLYDNRTVRPPVVPT